MREIYSPPQLPSSTLKKPFGRWQVLHRFVSPDSSHLSQTRSQPRSLAITSIPPTRLAPAVLCFQLCSSAIWSAFVGTSTSVGTRQSKILCLGLSLRLSFGRVWVTQEPPCIPHRVVLDKTPSTRKWKFTIGCLTLNILNLSNLILTELQKSPTSFDSLEKDVSLWSEQRKKKLDSWDALVGNGSVQASHTPRIHISRSLRIARPLIRRRGRRKRRNNVGKNTSGLETTLVLSSPPMLIPTKLSSLLVGLAKVWARSPASTILRRDTIRETVPNSKKMDQKNSDSLDNLCFVDWG